MRARIKKVNAKNNWSKLKLRKFYERFSQKYCEILRWKSLQLLGKHRLLTRASRDIHKISVIR